MENMKFQIKHHLNLLLEELNQQQERSGDKDPLFTTEAMAIGQFIKNIALETKDYELVGIAEAVCQKAKKLEDEEDKNYEEYQEWLYQEYWNSKDWFSPTDIGRKLNPQLSAAKTNKLLEKFGFQQAQKNGWIMTDKAAGLCQQRDTKQGERPYIQWKLDIVDKLKAELKTICM